MTAKFFYDTEFIEDGITIDLVSIGVVAEDGRTYYAISSEFNQAKLLRNQWLRDNVWNHLPTVDLGHGPELQLDHPDVKDRAQIRRELEEFLQPPDGDKIELWAYCSGYDHVALCQLWGRMIDTPDWMPYSTNDTRQEHERLRGSVLPAQDALGEHNALADALHTQKQHAALKAHERALMFELVKAALWQPSNPALFEPAPDWYSVMILRNLLDVDIIEFAEGLPNGTHDLVRVLDELAKSMSR